jgi:hypothetical protein
VRRLRIEPFRQRRRFLDFRKRRRHRLSLTLEIRGRGRLRDANR